MKRLPAEWSQHKSVWTAAPSHAEYWEGQLFCAQNCFLAFAKALLESSGETVNIWYDSDELTHQLEEFAHHYSNLNFEREPLGDIWFRDIGPLFVRANGDTPGAVIFNQNGWGGKYVMEHDDTVAYRICEQAEVDHEHVNLILEGGAIDVDGEGSALTTRSCLLNENRNPQVGQGEIEAILAEKLGAETLIWLDEGLLNDHTDGHIDNIARFVDIGRVVCQYPSGKDDPNAECYRKVIKELNRVRDNRGKQLEVVEVPSPGMVKDHAGSIMPASHMNFYISNRAVILPVYKSAGFEELVEILSSIFPTRKVIPIESKGLLYGGGSFHCITQQEPEF